jgi:hypothetical protein
MYNTELPILAFHPKLASFRVFMHNTLKLKPDQKLLILQCEIGLFPPTLLYDIIDTEKGRFFVSLGRQSSLSFGGRMLDVHVKYIAELKSA